jgi:hypothetical protein
MIETTVIGIDCSTDNAKVGLAVAQVHNADCAIQTVQICRGRESVAKKVAQLIETSNRTLLALDSPLGWPAPMSEALTKHSAGAPLVGDAHSLFRRSTDIYIKKHLGKQSLDVGADCIARTAHWTLSMLDEVRKISGLTIPLAWEPDFPERVAAIEVYPAATLVAHGIPSTGYKSFTVGSNQARGKIIGWLQKLIRISSDATIMQDNADAIDAGLCAFAGFEFLGGAASSPEQPDLAMREGWIWVRRKI